MSASGIVARSTHNVSSPGSPETVMTGEATHKPPNKLKNPPIKITTPTNKLIAAAYAIEIMATKSMSTKKVLGRG